MRRCCGRRLALRAEDICLNPTGQFYKGSGQARARACALSCTVNEWSDDAF